VRPAAALAFVLACAASLVAGACDQVSRCDDACELEHACDETRCSPSSPSSLPWQLRVVPRADSGLPPQQFASLGPETTVLTLTGPLTVRGTMRPPDDPSIINVPGELAFRAEGHIRGLTQRFVGRSLDGVDVSGDGFRVDLLAGLDYRVTFVPSDAAWPRMFFDLKASELPRDPSGRLSPSLLALPAGPAIPRFTGVVVTGAGAAVALARVSAFSPEGELLGVTLTDASAGTFSLPLAPSFSEISVRVEPPGSGASFPEFRIAAVPVASPARLTLPFDVIETATYRAVMRVTAGDGGPPVVGVPVTVIGLLDGGTVRTTAVTDGEGRVSLRTFAGAYECLVAVPGTAPWASWHGYVTLGPGLEPTIALGFRPQVAVAVRSHDGTPASGGYVTFERRAAPGAEGSLTIAPEPLTVDLDARGEAMVTLEPGRFAARFTPAPGSPAPMAWLADLLVETGGGELSWRLPQPAIIGLTVLGPDGEAVVGASVEFWVASREEGGSPTYVGRTLTDDRGALQVRVPLAEASP
jgi:hypothetical protein